MATEDDNVNAGALGTLMFVGAFATIGIALVVTALVRSEMSEEADKKDVGADRAYKDLVAEQTAKLSAPASYIDRGTGLVSLPIDRAMELVVSGLKKDPNSATPPPPKDAKAEDAAVPAPSSSGEAAPAAAEGAAAKDEAKPGEAKPQDAEKRDGEKKEAEKKDGEKKDKEKKEAPKPKAPAAPVPAAPAPAAPAPAAPAPAPNGQ